MIVEVRLFATLASYLPPDRQGAGAAVVDVPSGATVNDVAGQLGIPETIARVALVNGQETGLERRLAAGDVVTLFPPLMGGQ